MIKNLLFAVGVVIIMLAALWFFLNVFTYLLGVFCLLLAVIGVLLMLLSRIFS